MMVFRAALPMAGTWILSITQILLYGNLSLTDQRFHLPVPLQISGEGQTSALSRGNPQGMCAVSARVVGMCKYVPPYICPNN